MPRLWMVILMVIWLPTSWASTPRYPFETASQQAQFQALLHDLRCPVCQNQDLADSNADIAADLRQEVYQLVVAHKSDQDIVHYLTARYGDFILFKPSLTMTTSILWFGPLILLVIGLGLFALTCIRRERHE
ncbi:MAG: cytochrome C biogenesis protein [Legionella sp.]|nr:MAG: cytochrome C biogenesis protein [Legionella sp.]